jgi:hypothetical protein
MENNANEERLTQQRAENIQRLSELLEQRRNSNDPTSIHIEFRNADLRNAILMNANLEGANLESVDLEGANLEDANLRHANLDDANLENANLQDANLSNASVTHAFLRDANLQGAILIETNFSFSELVSVNLVGADLFGADLSNSILSDANLTGSHLFFTDFYHADLDSTIFTHARIHRTVFNDANVEDAIDLNQEDDEDDDDFELDEDVIHVPNGNIIPGQNQAQGVAFEVHNAFAKFESKKNDFLAIINQPDIYYVVTNIYSYIQQLFTSNIRYLFPDDNEKLNQFNSAFERINNRIPENDKDLIFKSINFVFSQEDNFRREYLITFLDESCRAYTGQGDNTSCVKGIIERFVLSIGSTVQILCTDGGCENNETYQKLDKLFNTKFDIAEASNDWWTNVATTSEVTELPSKEARKEHFKNYLRERARELNSYNNDVEQKITTWANDIDYSFEELKLGGRKTRKTKRTIKNKKPVKSKRNKKSRKSIRSTNSKKSRKTIRYQPLKNNRKTRKSDKKNY